MKSLHPEHNESAPSSAPFWQHQVRLKHLMTLSADWQSVSKTMSQIAAVLSANPLFDAFPAQREFWREGDLDRANDLLDQLYDFCDEHRIWVA